MPKPWLDTQQAADLLTELMERPVTRRQVLDWAKLNAPELRGVNVERLGRMWFLERASVLDTWERHARHTLAVVERERRMG